MPRVPGESDLARSVDVPQWSLAEPRWVARPEGEGRPPAYQHGDHVVRESTSTTV